MDENRDRSTFRTHSSLIRDNCHRAGHNYTDRLPFRFGDKGVNVRAQIAYADGYVRRFSGRGLSLAKARCPLLERTDNETRRLRYA